LNAFEGDSVLNLFFTWEIFIPKT